MITVQRVVLEVARKVTGSESSFVPQLPEGQRAARPLPRPARRPRLVAACGGADLKVVMDRLGHRQITTTQQYLGSLPDAGERALAAFEAIRNRRP